MRRSARQMKNARNMMIYYGRALAEFNPDCFCLSQQCQISASMPRAYEVEAADSAAGATVG
jgi:hypothetical protein